MRIVQEEMEESPCGQLCHQIDHELKKSFRVLHLFFSWLSYKCKIHELEEEENIIKGTDQQVHPKRSKRIS